jgi:DNA-binding transcriptional ArsR family regulator
MEAEGKELSLTAGIAACIGEPVRTRMLYCLMDGRARTGTELGAIAEVSASTASVHLARLKRFQLVKVLPQGRHRYYSLANAHVAAALEALSVVAGSQLRFVPSTPSRLRTARTCYDHMAGEVAVLLHDRLLTAGWLRTGAAGKTQYELSNQGMLQLQRVGLDVNSLLSARRCFAYACVDWSERRPHIGGALGAGLLQLALMRKWARRESDDRQLTITAHGRRELQQRFALTLRDER